MTPRKMMAVVALVAAATTLATTAAHAQTPFALRSVGQRLADGDARMLGRGGWGLAVADSLDPGYKNLASTAWVRQLGLSLTGYGEAGSHASDQGSRRTYRTYVPDVRVSVPIRKGELAFSAGFKLERGTGWKTKVDSTWTIWEGTDWEETITGNAQFEREGSVFKVPLALAWRPAPAFAGAVALNLERGSLRETLADYFLTPASGTTYLYRSVIASSEDQYSGASTTVAGLFLPRPDLRLGVTWTGSHTVDGHRKTETGGVGGRTYNDFEMKRPAELALGLAAPLGGRWEFGADLRRQDWRKLVAPVTWSAEAGWQDELVDELQFAFGVERRRANIRHGGAANLPLRIGAGWHRWPYRVGGNEIIERSLSVGTGFALKGGNGHLDAALTYGLVGDEADNGVRSRYVRLAVSVTGLEAWW